tara:strand:+ start:29 stop:784 length:756 start_codon:yes stop_codon:yes gene_type:complete
MKKNIINIVFKRLSILFVIIFSLSAIIDYKFLRGEALEVIVKVTIRNIIEKNNVIDVFLTKAFNKSSLFQTQKLIKEGSSIYKTTLIAPNLKESNEQLSLLRNELFSIEKQVNHDLKNFIKTNEPELIKFPDMQSKSDAAIIVDKNDIINNEQNQRRSKETEDLYKKAYQQRLDTIRREQGVDIGYFMVTNNENFLFVSVEKSSRNLFSLMNQVFKYCYLVILSLIISLFILYIVNTTRKATIIKILKNFT